MWNVVQFSGMHFVVAASCEFCFRVCQLSIWDLSPCPIWWALSVKLVCAQGWAFFSVKSLYPSPEFWEGI